MYRCLVGKPEYTAPELQGKSYADVDRSPETDCFGLAVLLFQLLMEGTHPYQAKGKLVDDAPSSQTKIIKGLFPYTMRTRDIAPPDHAPPFAILSPELRALFARCFAEGHLRPDLRPKASEWLQVLQNYWSSLKECTANGNHLFSPHLKFCPWCERYAKTGKDAFPSLTGLQIALPDPTQPLDSLDKRVEAFRSVYVAVALADGVITTAEEKFLLAKGKELQIPPTTVKDVIRAEVQKAGASTTASPPGTPQMEIVAGTFDFQNVRLGSTGSGSFTISNVGGGTLNGTITSDRKWLSVSQANIDPARHKQDVRFSLDTSSLPCGFRDTGEITVQSNGGSQTLPVTLLIEMPADDLARFRNGLVAASSVCGGLIGFSSYYIGFVQQNASGLTQNWAWLSAVCGVTAIAAHRGYLTAGGKGPGVKRAFGWGIGTWAGLVIVLGILTYFPNLALTVIWALNGTWLAYFLAVPLRRALWAHNTAAVRALAAGGLSLLALAACRT